MAKLYIVPTPIGNLKDITFRALEVLKSVDLILAEDTRNSSKLLKHFEIETPMKSYHMHNEHQSTEYFIDKIKQGQNMALISDAGTPCISDPGFLLTRQCVKNNIDIECLPGATAFVPALVNSGLPNDKFVFEGFLPDKKGRQTRLLFLQEETRSIVFYVSPHKLVKTLSEFIDYFGKNRQASISRELTKLHEQNLRGSLEELVDYYSKNGQVKGEIVLILAGKEKEKEIKHKKYDTQN